MPSPANNQAFKRRLTSSSLEELIVRDLVHRVVLASVGSLWNLQVACILIFPPFSTHTVNLNGPHAPLAGLNVRALCAPDNGGGGGGGSSGDGPGGASGD